MSTDARTTPTPLTRADHAAGGIWWADLATDDLAAAQAFYGALLGWEFQDNGQGYVLARRDGQVVAGLYELTAEARAAGVPAAWTVHVNVDSVEDAVARVRELGGAVVAEPHTVGGSDGVDGTVAMVTDPSGATFALWQPGQHSGAGLFDAPGALSGTEFWSRDAAVSRAFLTELFGWEAAELEGGPVPYTLLSNAGTTVAGMVELGGAHGEGEPSSWTAHFRVEDMESAHEVVERHGCQVTFGPMKTPGGTVMSFADPQGTHLVLDA